MGFLEGFKKNIKKVAVGSAVVAGSVLPPESTAQEVKQNNEKINKTEVSMDPEFYRAGYIKYMEHPSYKIRLAKEMYGDTIINKDGQQIIDFEYQKRLNQIKTIPINMLPNIYENSSDPSYYSQNENKVYTTSYASSHELSHAADYSDKFLNREMGLETVLNKFLINREIEYFTFISSPETEVYRQKMLLFSVIVKQYILENKDKVKLTVPDYFLSENESPYDFIMTILNELNLKDFTLKKYNEFISFSDRQIINNDNQIKELTVDIERYLAKLEKLQNNHFYYYKNTEIKARLNHLRLRAKNEFHFDLNNEFNINEFNELKNDQQYEELKEKLNLSDEQINELMKYTADNNENFNKDRTYVHPQWNYRESDNKA